MDFDSKIAQHKHAIKELQEQKKQAIAQKADEVMKHCLPVLLNQVSKSNKLPVLIAARQIGDGSHLDMKWIAKTCGYSVVKSVHIGYRVTCKGCNHNNWYNPKLLQVELDDDGGWEDVIKNVTKEVFMPINPTRVFVFSNLIDPYGEETEEGKGMIAETGWLFSKS